MTEELSELEQEQYDHLLPIARHELGHYVLARHVEFRTYGVIITAKTPLMSAGGQAEIGLIRPIRTLADVRAYCEDRIRVLSAGGLAEAMEAGVINHEAAVRSAKATGDNDFTKVREHLRLLHNLEHPDLIDENQVNRELNDSYSRLWNDASQLVVRFSELIEQLADELTRKYAVEFQVPEFSENELSKHPLVLKYFR